MMSAVPSHHPKYRTKLCRNFSNGTCPFGQKCSFLHPAPPLSSALAQYLFNWNMFLPQLLALQQGTLKKIPQRSPSHLQGPKLVDEDPSPPASLLLSTSESTPSERIPQTRRSNKRKKLPCKEFIRTGGWCQAGEKCKFHHDVTALPPTESGMVQHAPPFEPDVDRDGVRSKTSGVLFGGQVPSPPVISQEYPEPSRYTKAESAQPYQPLYWPGYAWQPYQPYHPFVPATTAALVPANMAPSLTVQSNTYHMPQHSVQSVTQNESQTSLPLGAYEVNGTTYFPTKIPSAPAPPVPTQLAPYNHAIPHTMPLAYPYYAPPMPANYYNIPNQTVGVPLQASFSPSSSDPMVHNELPVIPRLEDCQMSPIQHADHRRPLSLPRVLSGDQPTGSREQEFPYQPPREQRVGHARRISINIKKPGRASCG